MIKYLFACHVPSFAHAIDVPLSLREIAAPALRDEFDPATSIALTFDDGPHPEGTPAVLQALAEAGSHATFFLVGERVRSHPELVARILADGHSIALHCDLHLVQLRRSPAAVRADIDRGRAAIEDASGVSPRWHRPPLGIYSPAGLRHVRQLGMQPILWSKWGRDWRRYTTPERIHRRVVTGQRAGDVILLHDSDYYSGKGSHRHTVIAVRSILATLQEAGLATVRMAYDDT